MLTRYMAKEFGPRGIRANSISPGAIRTDMTSGAFDQSPEFVTMLAGQTALGRIGAPDAKAGSTRSDGMTAPS